MGAIERRGTPLFYRSRGIRLATPPAQIREVAPARECRPDAGARTQGRSASPGRFAQRMNRQAAPSKPMKEGALRRCIYDP
jgi:hypothetical protein